MTDKDRQAVYRLIRMSITNLDIVRGAVRDKDFVFASAIYSRLETDLHMLRNLIQIEEPT